MGNVKSGISTGLFDTLRNSSFEVIFEHD